METLIYSAGWFVFSKVKDNIYDKGYGFVFGNKNEHLEKKIDILIKQNERLQRDILKIKNKDEEKQLQEDDEIQQLNYDIIIIDDYI